ncbi:MAG: hypothetical protein HY815_03880 [Candidatus Riflebacteria bacterium]|nr:hypothetical protein [Candidatus Riflebacteria bacterium]
MAIDRGSTLLLEELFDSQGPAFLDELRRVDDAGSLQAFADRWASDPRPWARGQILAYLAAPLASPGHEPLVKRLFKHAEGCKDDELMAAFLLAFDRLVRRVRRIRHRWDASVNAVLDEELLVCVRNTIPRARKGKDFLGRPISWRGRVKKGALLFSHRTRHHLRRRAWRYFRRMGFSRPSAYLEAVPRFLIAYRDEDLATGENILDSWGLMNALFRHSPALRFGASQVRVAEGHSLSELSSAPRFPVLWGSAEALPRLFDLVLEARSRLVRVWAIKTLERLHQERLAGLEPLRIKRLLEHDDEEVQRFGADLLTRARGLSTLPVDGWLELLGTESVAALETICRLFEANVGGDRLTLTQCLAIASASAAPVARLGAAYLRIRQIGPDQVRELAVLADARCPALAAELASLSLGRLGAPEVYDPDPVSRFFDSRSIQVRQKAMEWLVENPQARDDARLWARLLETPFDEVRHWIVTQLEARVSLPGAGPAELVPVWCSLLLAVHRGSRSKGKAIRQLGEAIRRDPAQAGSLLPVLAVALRSVRASEMRAGLAAAVGALQACPELEELLKRHVPELSTSLGEGGR